MKNWRTMSARKMMSIMRLRRNHPSRHGSTAESISTNAVSHGVTSAVVTSAIIVVKSHHGSKVDSLG